MGQITLWYYIYIVWIYYRNSDFIEPFSGGIWMPKFSINVGLLLFLWLWKNNDLTQDFFFFICRSTVSWENRNWVYEEGWNSSWIPLRTSLTSTYSRYDMSLKNICNFRDPNILIFIYFLSAKTVTFPKGVNVLDN